MDTPFLVSPPQLAISGMPINQAQRVDVNHCLLYGFTAASATSHGLVDQNKLYFEDFPNFNFENYLPGAEVSSKDCYSFVSVELPSPYPRPMGTSRMESDGHDNIYFRLAHVGGSQEKISQLERELVSLTAKLMDKRDTNCNG
jgi:hypothetical protein